ncbi:MAG: radical SAM protein [Candidatus Omnitrophota bacterium]|nr:radical SAM protein [Candidatus Omnitrophota bacterium]
MNDRISVVWNITRLCPFACSFCCVSAVHVKNFQQISPNNDDTPVLAGELSFRCQVDIVDQMDADDFRIDFSGGDVLINPRNIDLVLYTSAKFGSDNVSLSIPGTFLTNWVLDRLLGKVSDIEITLDNLPSVKDDSRPLGYPKIATESLKRLVEHGFRVGVQTVLKQENMNANTLEGLHHLLVNIGVQKWSLLKFFPVGRYFQRSHYVPSDKTYQETVEFIQGLTVNSPVKVHFQYLMPQCEKHDFRCRAVSRSIGILPSGKVNACFWALNRRGEPLSDFLLGKLPEENIYDVLKSEKAEHWRCQQRIVNNCELFERMEVK